MAGIIAVAPDLVPVVFGEQWTPSINVLRILSVLMAIQSVLTTSGIVLMSFGRSDLLLRNSLYLTPAIMVALILGANFGIEGAAIGYSLVSLVSYFALTILACRELQISAFKYLARLLPWSLAAITMALCVSVISGILSDSAAWLRLTICIISGIAIYISILLLFVRSATLIITNDILSRMKPS